MIDKELLKLLGGNKKYLFLTVGLMLIGTAANIGVTACICYIVKLLIDSAAESQFTLPALLALCCVAIRYRLCPYV